MMIDGILTYRIDTGTVHHICDNRLRMRRCHQVVSIAFTSYLREMSGIINIIDNRNVYTSPIVF